MKVCTHKGMDIVVLTRNEHCPPHVHVGTAKWEARFQFSFWHNGTKLWDVAPTHNQPTAAVLEDLRLVFKQPQNLRRAREVWWTSMQTICLSHQQWDVNAEEVVSPKASRIHAIDIISSQFDRRTYRTILQLAGQSTPLEIEL